MMCIHVRELQRDEYDLWDDLVSESPQGTIFHSIQWLRTTSESLHIPFVLIGAFDDDQLVGGCCFFQQKRLHFFKQAMTNAQLTPYSGFLIRGCCSPEIRGEDTLYKTILTALSERISTMNCVHVCIVNNPSLMDIRPLTWDGWKTSVYYTYILPLDGEMDVFSSRNMRRSIFKAHEEEISIQKIHNPTIMWELQVKTFKKQNTDVPFKKEQLFNLMDMVQKNGTGEMWLATTRDNIPIAGEFILRDTQGAYRWVAAADPDLLRTGATSLLLYEIISSLKSIGVPRFFMMAANTPQLSAFASNFNPVLTPYYEVMKESSGIELIKKIKNLLNST